MTTSNNHNNDFQFSEAPSSWNTRYISPDGFECQLTIRGERGAEVLEKASAAIAYLLKQDCQPYSYSRNSYRTKKASTKPTNGDKPSPNSNHAKGFCPIHECEMKRWERDGRVCISEAGLRYPPVSLTQPISSRRTMMSPPYSWPKNVSPVQE